MRIFGHDNQSAASDRASHDAYCRRMGALIAKKDRGVQLAPSEVDEIRAYLAPKATGVKKFGRTVSHLTGLGKTRAERHEDSLLRSHTIDRPGSSEITAGAGDRIERRPAPSAREADSVTAALYQRQSRHRDLNADEQAALRSAIAPQATGFKKIGRSLSHALGHGPTQGERRDTMLLASHGLQHSQTAPAHIATMADDRAGLSQFSAPCA